MGEFSAQLLDALFPKGLGDLGLGVCDPLCEPIHLSWQALRDLGEALVLLLVCLFAQLRRCRESFLKGAHRFFTHREDGRGRL